MFSNIRQDARECSEAKSVVLRYRDVMFATLRGGQAQMTAGLSTDAVAEDFESFSEICPRDIPGKPHRVRTSSRT